MPHMNARLRGLVVGTLTSTVWFSGRSLDSFRSGKTTYFAQVLSVVRVNLKVSVWPFLTSTLAGVKPWSSAVIVTTLGEWVALLQPAAPATRAVDSNA